MTSARRQPRLDREEQLELARSYHHGNRQAGQALALSNLGLVVRIARQLGKHLRGHELDLIQEGNEGLLRAMRLFDPDRGVAFTTYAAWWIRAYVFRYVLQNWRLVRIGATAAQRRAFFNLSREKRRLEARGERADLAVLSSRLGVEEQELGNLARHIATPEAGEDSALSLRAPLTEQPDEKLARREQEEILHTVLDELEREAPERERRVIEARWRREEPVTLRACGKSLGISGERVRQIEQDLTLRLRRGVTRATHGLQKSA